jgi:hypothetical protein
MFGTIVKIVGLKPVQDLLAALTGKLFGAKGAVKNKVSATFGAAAIIGILILIAKQIDPGLGDILAGHEVTLLGMVALVQVLIAYFTKEEQA